MQSVPQLQLLNPGGLQLLYDSFLQAGRGDNAPGAVNPNVVTDERGGAYTALGSFSSVIAAGGQGAAGIIFDGNAQPTVPSYNPAGTIEHRPHLLSAQPTLIVPGHNPLYLQYLGTSIPDLNDPWSWFMYPNVHGNNRVVYGDGHFTDQNVQAPVNIGTPGHYVVQVHFIGQYNSTTNVSVQVKMDGVVIDAGVSTTPLMTHFFNRSGDRQSFVPKGHEWDASSGDHTISLECSDANFKMGPWVAVFFYIPGHPLQSPLAPAGVYTQYGNVVSRIETSGTWIQFTPRLQRFMFMAAISGYGPGTNTIGNVDLHPVGGTNVPIAGCLAAVNPGLVHSQIGMPAIFGSIGGAAGGVLTFYGWGEGTEPTPMNFSTDSNDHQSFTFLPLPYIG